MWIPYIILGLVAIYIIVLFLWPAGRDLNSQSPTIETMDDYRKKQGYTSCRDYWVKQGVLKKRTIEKDW